MPAPTDNFIVPAIPPGKSLLVLPEEMDFVQADDRRSGLLIDGGGRIALMVNGTGVRCRFEDMEALCLIGWQLLRTAVDLNDNARDLVERALHAATTGASPNDGEDHG